MSQNTYQVYIIDLIDCDLNIDDAFNNLCECFKNEVSLTSENQFNTRLIEWYYLQKHLEEDFNIDLSTYQIKKNKYGKPYLQSNEPKIFFNITNSANLIAIIIGYDECGIDVEIIKERTNLNLLIKKIFTDDEIKKINELTSAQRLNILIKEWTRIEAYQKMIGMGLRLNHIVKPIVNNIITKKIQDTLNNNYYLSYCLAEQKYKYKIKKEEDQNGKRN